jgi:CCR4-NOT transcription complex subunit 6
MYSGLIYFCFFSLLSCFKAAWKGHSTAKHSQLSSIGHQTNEKLDDKENIHKRTRSLLAMDVADESSQGAASPTNLIVHENGEVGRAAIDDVEPSARMASPAPDASWTPLSTDKAYVPTKDDVGCVLKIEVTALTVSDNSVLAGPLVSFTEPVLAAPRGPPKRQLVTAPAPASSGSTGTRFRIISYNILAEQYATKQVQRQFHVCICVLYAVRLHVCIRRHQ